MTQMGIEVLMRYQDDPKKCTAARLVKAGLARKVTSAVGGRKVILNPYCGKVLVPADRHATRALVGIDCSWRLADAEFGVIVRGGGAPSRPHTYKRSSHPAGRAPRPALLPTSHPYANTGRCLPPLLAGNSLNYARVGMLTTAEALAASLFIMGLDEQGHELLERFRWGHTFYELNSRILTEYAQASRREDMMPIAVSYGLAAA